MSEKRPLHEYTAHLNANELIRLIGEYSKITVKAVNADSALEKARKIFKDKIQTEVAHLELEG